MKFSSIRAFIGTEFTAVSDEAKTELHRFLDFVEQKQKHLNEAKELLQANGFVVTEAQPPTPAPAQPNLPAIPATTT